MLRVAAENRKKGEQQGEHIAGVPYLKMQMNSVPAGGAFGAAETLVSPVTLVLYVEILEMFKNHITAIEKNKYIVMYMYMTLNYFPALIIVTFIHQNKGKF